MPVQRLGAWLARGAERAGRRAAAVAGLALLAAALALVYTVRELGIDTDTAEMLSAELPFRQAYRQYQSQFPQYLDTLLLVIDGPDPEAARSAARRLAGTLAADRERFKTVWAPGVEPFFRDHALLYLEREELEALVDELARLQPFLARLTADPSLRGLLDMLGAALEALRDGEALELGPLLEAVDATVQGALQGSARRLSWEALMAGDEATPARQLLLVQPRLDYGRLLAGGPALEAVRGHARRLEIGPERGLRLRITGGVALAHEELASVSRGAALAAGAALVMVLGALWWGLRSPALVLAVLLTLVCGLSLTAAFATVAVGTLNLISVAFAVLYVGLGVDFAIHLTMAYRELRLWGRPPAAALAGAARAVGPSLLLCALTTMVGFYAFVPTDYAGVAELGLIAGTGMAIGLLLSLSLLPALLGLLAPDPGGRPAAAGWPARLGGWSRDHARGVRRGALLLAVAALVPAARVGFDPNPLNLRDPHSESVATFRDLMAAGDARPWTLTVLAPDAAAARALQARLERLAPVERVLGLDSFIPKDQPDKLALLDDLALLLGPRPALDAAPPALAEQRAALDRVLAVLADWPRPRPQALARLESRLRALAAALADPRQGPALLARLEPALLETLPESLERLYTALDAGPVAPAGLPEDLRRRWLSPAGVYRLQVFPREDLNDPRALRRFVDGVRALAPAATDTPVLVLEAGDAVVRAFVQALLVAGLAITLLLWWLLGGLGDALRVLAPLLLGGLLTVAAMGLAGLSFNFANVIALPLLLGIGVDNGIHLLRQWASPGPGGADLRGATVRAMVFSALTTILSFGNLGFSAHRGTAGMGLLLTLGLLLSLAATLILLPALAGRRQGHPP